MSSILGRLKLGGSLPSGEQWQAGFYITSKTATAFDLATAIAWAHGFMQSIATGSTNLATLYNTGTTFAPCQVDLINVGTGKTQERGFDTVTFTGGQVSSAASLPPSVAVAVTLRSETAGPAGRGRFYLPAPVTTAAANTGRMTSAALTTFSGALASAFTAAESGHTDIIPAVWSKTHNQIHFVQRADIGDVYDSQRSRRDKLVEARSSVING